MLLNEISKYSMLEYLLIGITSLSISIETIIMYLNKQAI